MTPLLNPVLLSILMIGGVLLATGIDYRTYFNGAQFVHFLLGPATVALAIPLYRQIRLLLRSLTAVVVGLLVGAATAAASAMGLAWVLGASERTILSLGPKSATAPIAMAVSESIGGLPSLSAVMAILTGITGSVVAVWVLDAVRVRNVVTNLENVVDLSGLFIYVGLEPNSELVRWMAGMYSSTYWLYAFLGGAMIIWQHRDNVQRILRGNERRLGQPAGKDG